MSSEKSGERSISKLASDRAEQLRREEARRAGKPTEAEVKERAEAITRAKMLGSSFVPEWYLPLQAILPVVMLVVPIVLLPFLRVVGVHARVLLVVSSGALGALFPLAMKALYKRRGLRWLNRVRLPFRWDPEAYVDLFSRGFGPVYRPVHLVVSITLNSRVPPEWQKTVTQAIEMLVDTSRFHWEDELHLEVRSPVLQTTEPRTIHRWFRRLIERALPVLHREFPLASIDISCQEAP